MEYIVYSMFFIALFIRIGLFFYNVDRKPAFYSDEVTHLGIEKVYVSVHNNKKNKEEYLKKHFYFTKNLGYPTLYHQLVNLISPDYSLSFRRRLSNLFGILVPFVFFILMHDEYSLTTFLLISVFMLVSLNSFGLFAKMYISYTERPFADFLIFLSFLFMYIYLQENSYIYFTLSVLALIPIWFSSKFGIQAIVLIPLTYLVLSGDNSLVFIMLVSFTLSYIISKDRLIGVIEGHFGHMLWFFRNYSWLNKKEKLKNFGLKNIYIFITSTSLIGKLIQFIPIFPFLFLYILFSEMTDSNLLLLSALFVSVLTIFNPFVAIGPSYRYTWYFLPMILGLMVEEYLVVSILYIFIEMSIAIFFSFKLFSTKNMSYEKIFDEYISITKELSFKGKNILTSPTRIADMHFGIKDELDSKLYAFWNFGTNLDAIRSYEKYMPTYPNVTNETNKLKEMIHEYHFDIFIIDKILTDKFYHKENAYAGFIENKEILYQSERFLVVDINNGRNKCAE